MASEITCLMFPGALAVSLLVLVEYRFMLRLFVIDPKRLLYHSELFLIFAAAVSILYH